MKEITATLFFWGKSVNNNEFSFSSLVENGNVIPVVRRLGFVIR